MTGITPGDYKLFSWETTEDFEPDWSDPEWLKPKESKGESIHFDDADKNRSTSR